MIPGLPDPATTIEVTPRTVADLAQAIADGECRLVDCREDDEWAICRLPDARLVPLSRFVEKAAALIEERVPVIVYCHHGMRSMQAVAWLRSRGLAEAWSMSGGIDRWSDEIDPHVPRY